MRDEEEQELVGLRPVFSFIPNPSALIPSLNLFLSSYVMTASFVASWFERQCLLKIKFSGK
ncbi:MAG: hypothetical protein QOH63_2506 [Acidobacteriota bacterium]|jgi:hypothetical protein|nr:hypothetical protein [Acidobacteriota bacterium]